MVVIGFSNIGRKIWKMIKGVNEKKSIGDPQ